MNACRAKIGGVEQYLDQILPEFQGRGCEVGLWHETEGPAARDSIALPDRARAWCAERSGFATSVAELRQWQPDIITCHGHLRLETQRAMFETAPSVFFAHAYHGTCISGLKTTQFPVVTPCQRRFGPACLLHYFPRHCGGRNPLTMFRLYERESRQFSLLQQYRVILTYSAYVRDEYIRNGIPKERVQQIQYVVTPPEDEPHPPVELDVAGPVTLLFLGRMERIKGGDMLLDALPLVHAKVHRPVHAIFAGDGPQRSKWQRAANALQARTPGVSTEFPGWTPRDAIGALMARAHLVVLPSLWPEPFGMVGAEAGLYGVPSAAFAVGGIPDWLENGVNGYLAPADPPTPAGLAEAIRKCVSDPATHRRLAAGALARAERLRVDQHVSELLDIFEAIVQA